MEADKNVWVYTFRWPEDYFWSGGRFAGLPQKRSVPNGLVFAVLIQHEPANEFGILGSIEHWNWYAEDLKCLHAPADSENRYERRLWTRNI